MHYFIGKYCPQLEQDKEFVRKDSQSLSRAPTTWGVRGLDRVLQSWPLRLIDFCLSYNSRAFRSCFTSILLGLNTKTVRNSTT